MIVCEEIKKKERRKKEKRNEVSASVFFRLRYCRILLWSFSRRVTFRLIYRFWAKYFESQQKQPSLSLFRITTDVLRLGNSQRRSRLDIFGVLTKKGDLQLWALNRSIALIADSTHGLIGGFQYLSWYGI